MRIRGKTILLAVALCLAVATPALAQGKPELWNGTHWKDMTQEIKVAYIKGIGNMADFEVAAAAKGQAPCISQAFVAELKNRSLASLVQEVDKFYKESPDKLTTPVIEVVLRRCTSLCPPEAPKAAGKGK